ncbi:MAG: choice-of-anchor L domain-containing protein [Bacteroidota bacterium]
MFSSVKCALFCVLATIPVFLSAQKTEQSGNIVFRDGQKRNVITARSQNQTVELSQLKPGENYVLIVPPDFALGTCIPDLSVVEPTAMQSSWSSLHHTLNFTAISTTARVKLSYPCSWQESDPPRHYISLSCLSCLPEADNQNSAELAVLEVESAGVEELIREVFIGGDCFDVNGVTLNGGADQIGKFFNGLTNIGFETGMILATGDIGVAPGPNSSDGAGGGGAGNSDSDLAAISSGPMFDAAVVEFDFTPTQSLLSFEYVFASEEYCEYVNSQFNDVFGFFISGPGIPGTQNLAVIPTTTTPITINTINHVTNSGLYVHNTPPGLDNCEDGGFTGTVPPVPPAMGSGPQECEFDGFTRRMTAVAQVIPCSTYHIKLAIADIGDGLWDSAVFLKAGSFSGGGNASIKWVVNDDPELNEVTEGCGDVKILADRLSSNLLNPLTVGFTITGSATSGADFVPIPGSITIPAGQDQVLFPVTILNDLLEEGAETIILTLNNPCSCLRPQEVLTILDYQPMKPVADTVYVCGPNGFGTVGVNVEGGREPYTYQWSTGLTEQTMTTSVSFSSTFTVTVTDACGKTKVAYARINVTPMPIAQLLPPAPQLCPGQSATIQVTFNGSGPFELVYSLNYNNQSPITNITDNPYTLHVTQPGLYLIASVIDSLGCPGAGAGAINVLASNLALSATSANPACPLSADGSINTTVTGGTSPYNYTWAGPVPIGNVADPLNLLPGQYRLTVTDASGCTQTQTFTLVAPNPITPSAVIQGITCAAPLAGSVDVSVSGGVPEYAYKWSDGSTVQDINNLPAGSYTVTISDNGGCSTIYTAVVPGNTTPPVASAVSDGVLTCTNTTVSLNGTNSSVGTEYIYQWLAPQGYIVSGDNTLAPVVNHGGNYTLQVTNTTNGCTASATVSVISEIIPPVVNAGQDAVITCSIDTIALSANGSSQGSEFLYHWTANGGGFIIGTDTSYSVMTTSTGTYTLQITNTANGCTASDIVSVSQNTTPPAAAAAGGEITCVVSNVMIQGSSSSGPGISYSWTAGQGGNIVSGAGTPTPVVNAPGLYTLTVTSSVNGCTSTAIAAVNTNLTPPVASAVPNGIITCAVPAVTINSTGSSSGTGYSYQWITPGGQTFSGVSLQALNTGTYTLIVTNTSNGCTTGTTAVVQSSLAAPVADAGNENTLTCAQPTLGLSGTGSGAPLLTYSWTTLNGSFVSATNIPNPVVDQPGIYTLVVTNPVNGCTSSSSVTINQAPNLPVAAIAAAPSLNCDVTSLNLNATASSTGGNFTYQWTAANGGNIVSGTGTLTPLIDKPGTYSLLVTDLGNQCTKTAFVVVSEDVVLPVADAGPGGTITCTTTQLLLSGSVQTPQNNYSVSWTASNGGNITVNPNTLTPTVNTGGTYTMTVKNNVNGCVSSDVVSVQENQIYPAAIIASPATLTCTTQTASLNPGGSSTVNANYVWTTGNGHFIQPLDPNMPVVDQPGTYTLLVTYQNNGCTASASVTVQQDILNPAVNAGADGLLTCAVTTTQLNGSVVGQSGNFLYQWFASGGGQIVSGGNTPSPVAGTGGTYTLIVTNSANGCTSSDVAVVNTDTQVPAVAIASPGIISCVVPQVQLNGSGSQSGPFIQYNWSTVNGQIVSTSGPNCLAGKSGTYSLTVLNTVNGCSSQQTVTVTDNIQLPTVEAGPSSMLNCTVAEATLNGTGTSSGQNYNYSWSTQDGNILSGSSTLSPVVNEPGIYTLQVTNTTTGCKNTDDVQVLLDTNVPTDIVVDLKRPGCKDNDGEIRFKEIKGGTGPYLYSIDGGETFVEAIDFEQIAPGLYNLYIQDLNGCEYEENITVPSAPDPAISIEPLFELELGDSLKLSATLPSGYPLSLIDTIIWTPLEGLNFRSNSIQDRLTPYVKPFSTAEYTVRIISKDGCEDRDNVVILVNTEPHIYIPNVFSPWKEDGDNDVFLIFASDKQIAQIDRFQVFDRWGEMVFTDSNFQPNDPAHGWTGYHNGRLLTPAVFVYYAEISLIDGRKLLYKGDVTLVR